MSGISTVDRNKWNMIAFIKETATPEAIARFRSMMHDMQTQKKEVRAFQSMRHPVGVSFRSVNACLPTQIIITLIVQPA
jgi:hypothetical protein